MKSFVVTAVLGALYMFFLSFGVDQCHCVYLGFLSFSMLLGRRDWIFF